jgi:hypothetical protein
MCKAVVWLFLSILVETWANILVPELAWFSFVLVLWEYLET